MPSRADNFKNTPSEALPAPAELRIAFFMSAVTHDTARVVDDGIALNDAFYEPVRNDEEARDCMLKAAAIYKIYKIKVPIIRAYLKGREVLFVKFAGQDIEPIRKRKARSFRGKTHPEEQKTDIQRISSRLPGLLERAEQVILAKFGTELGQDAYFKTGVPLQSPVASVPEPRPGSDNGTNTQELPPAKDGGAHADTPAVPVPITAPHSKQEAMTSTEGTEVQRPKGAPESKKGQDEPPKVSDAVRRLRERFHEDEEAL